MTYKIDQIHIETRDREIKEITFCYTGKGWTRSTTEVSTTSDGVEEATSTGACTAEDVIAALLMNMSQEGTMISANKGPMGTWILSQAWTSRDIHRLNEDGEWYQPYLKSAVAENYLCTCVGDDTLKIG